MELGLRPPSGGENVWSPKSTLLNFPVSSCRLANLRLGSLRLGNRERGDHGDTAGGSDWGGNDGQWHCPCVCAERIQRRALRRGAAVSRSRPRYDCEEPGSRSRQEQDYDGRQGVLAGADYGGGGSGEVGGLRSGD